MPADTVDNDIWVNVHVTNRTDRQGAINHISSFNVQFLFVSVIETISSISINISLLNTVYCI